MSDEHVPDPVRGAQRNPLWLTAAVLALALAVRLAYVAQLRGSILLEFPQGDAALHFDMAREIAGGDWLGDRVFYLAPLYPYFVATIFALAGTSVFALVLIQVVLSVLQVWIIMTVARKLFGQAVGVIAGCMAACYGPFVFYTGFLLKETLGLVLLDGFVLSALWIARRRASCCGVLPGAIFGLVSLVRPNLLPLAVAIAAWLWIELRGTSWINRITAVLFFVSGVCIAVIPVTWRNHVVANEWVLISAHGGHNFFIGNRPSAKGVYEPLKPGGGQTPFEEEQDAREIAERATGRALRASEVSAYWYTRGWREIRNDPFHFVGLTLRKFALFWNNYEIPDVQDFYFLRRECPALRLAPLTLGLAAPLAAWGLVVSRHEWRRCMLLYLLMAGVVLSVIPFFVFARYRLPVVPIVLVFAAVGATAVGRSIAARDWPHLLLSLAIIAPLTIVVNWPIYGSIKSGHLATSYFNIGQLYREAGRPDDAVASWEEAVRLNPDYRKPHRALGVAYFEAGRFSEAAQSFARAAGITTDGVPTDREIAYMLAMSFLRGGQSAAAERIFLRGNELWPADRRFADGLNKVREGTGK